MASNGYKCENVTRSGVIWLGVTCPAGTWDAIKQTGGADGSLRLELAQAENGGLKYGQVGGPQTRCLSG
jgi:hypothetical protein